MSKLAKVLRLARYYAQEQTTSNFDKLIEAAWKISISEINAHFADRCIGDTVWFVYRDAYSMKVCKGAIIGISDVADSIYYKIDSLGLIDCTIANYRVFDMEDAAREYRKGWLADD